MCSKHQTLDSQKTRERKMPEETTTETPVVKQEAEDTKTDKELIAEEEAAAETKAENEGEKEVTEEAEEKPKKEKKEKKPCLLTSDWEEGKVYLYQSNRTPRIPSLFPRELLLEPVILPPKAT